MTDLAGLEDHDDGVVRRRLLVGASIERADLWWQPFVDGDRLAWTEAPPSSSAVTTSLVTVFTTSGPVTNM